MNVSLDTGGMFFYNPLTGNGPWTEDSRANMPEVGAGFVEDVL